MKLTPAEAVANVAQSDPNVAASIGSMLSIIEAVLLSMGITAPTAAVATSQGVSSSGSQQQPTTSLTSATPQQEADVKAKQAELATRTQATDAAAAATDATIKAAK